MKIGNPINGADVDGVGEFSDTRIDLAEAARKAARGAEDRAFDHASEQCDESECQGYNEVNVDTSCTILDLYTGEIFEWSPGNPLPEIDPMLGLQ